MKITIKKYSKISEGCESGVKRQKMEKSIKMEFKIEPDMIKMEPDALSTICDSTVSVGITKSFTFDCTFCKK